MRRLSEILREQRQLNDDTLAQERGERPGQSGQEQGGQAPGQQPGQQSRAQPPLLALIAPGLAWPALTHRHHNTSWLTRNAAASVASASKV